MDGDKISIIIPVYNAEQYVARCLDSVMEQTFKNYNVIIVDDGSTDRSLEIIKKYEKQYSNLTVICQKNAKAAAARNTGLKNATGEYIAFVDADDYVHKDYLRILYENMIAFDAEVSTCGYYKSSKDIFKEIDLSKNAPYWRTNIDVMYECCDINKTAIVSPWCKLYKKELFQGIGYPEGRTYEDLATTHKIMYKAKGIVTTDLTLYCYFNTPQSVVHGKYSYLNFYSENVAQDERLTFFENIGIDSLTKKNMIAVERNRITNYCRGILYLPEDKEKCIELKNKFDDTFQVLKRKYKLKLIDYLIFQGFSICPTIYAYCLYYAYNILNKIKRKIK